MFEDTLDQGGLNVQKNEVAEISDKEDAAITVQEALPDSIVDDVTQLLREIIRDIGENLSDCCEESDLKPTPDE